MRTCYDIFGKLHTLRDGPSDLRPYASNNISPIPLQRIYILRHDRIYSRVLAYKPTSISTRTTTVLCDHHVIHSAKDTWRLNHYLIALLNANQKTVKARWKNLSLIFYQPYGQVIPLLCRGPL